MQEFLQAVQYDAERGAYAEPHLEEALFQLSQNDPSLQEQARKELKTYVALFQRQHAGSLPPNMYIIYDYFMLTGDKSWYVPPAGVISTKNVESLNVTQGAARVANAAEVVARATGGSERTEAVSSSSAERRPPRSLRLRRRRHRRQRNRTDRCNDPLNTGGASRFRCASHEFCSGFNGGPIHLSGCFAYGF